MEFEIELDVRWADVDMNRHVRHSAYYDYGAHTRMAYLTRAGYDAEAMGRKGFGPILFSEKCTFLREIKSNARIRINLLAGEMAPDGSKWTLHHEYFDQEGNKLAHVSVQGAWMDLRARKLIPPPDDLKTSFFELDKGEDFVYKK